MKRIAVALAVLLHVAPAGAHHSYGGYDVDERYEFSGTLTDLQWANPHILLSISDGKETMRIEWMTLTGAERTGVTKEQFSIGERITVIGSRNKDPAVPIITVIKQVDLPDDDWSWKKP